MSKLTRRTLIKAMASAPVAASLSGCFWFPVKFDHGVASGDPTETSVIIWSRVTTDAPYMPVRWEVSRNRRFRGVAAKGIVQTDSSRDFTVKVDVGGLRPGKKYYFRFIANNVVSQVGETRTVRSRNLNEVSLAVVSCSNYPAGYFNVYREIVSQHQQRPFDACLHLGDYIYEYGNGGYATEDAEALGRLPSKGTECITLDDYRKRYAQYRTDPDLKALHASMPMIAVWDDHEIANDAWREGAENHQPDEGEFSERRAAALMAWLEWLPVRENPENASNIYREVAFGDLASIYMLDTRVTARDEPLDYANINPSDPAQLGALLAQAASPTRQLLGEAQKNWLSGSLANSPAQWQVFGQQILMAKMQLPAPVLLALFGVLNATPEQLPAALQNMQLAIQDALVNPGSPQNQLKLPYNLDAWDGYMADREWLYATCKALGKQRVVSLAGDTHNAWCSQLADMSGTPVGIEFATSSVSSPGIETYLPLPAEQVEQLRGSLIAMIDELQWADISQRGLMRLTLTREKVQAEWTLVDTVKSQTYTTQSIQLSSSDGQALDIP
ncbi:alkaline phosphatase D family protein [Parasalinivibrio latis]|uniref:alkaline phosphatase D family protein n=1 Tax=Parasalinivibrio latis TaxID=2952610 RepID=UPI0030E494F7